MLEVADLTRVYGSGDTLVSALAGVSFSLATGSSLAIVGRSGSGKSTLLNLLGAVDRPTSGHITIAGQDLAALADSQLATFRRRRLGFIFQAFHLIPTLDVFDNVAIPWMLDGALNTDRTQQVRDLLARIGLADLEHRYPDELSGGQQQRVAIARAVIHQPALLLADEPTGNLDVASGCTVLDLLSELQRERRLTIVMATHSAEAAARCDAQLQLEDGRIVQAER